MIPFPSIDEFEVVSGDLTIDEILNGVSNTYGIPCVAESSGDVVLVGRWTDPKELNAALEAKAGLVPYLRNGVWFYSGDRSNDLVFVEWVSGLSQQEATEIVSKLKMSDSFVVKQSGVAFIGVTPARVELLEKTLKGLESGDDWLVQVSIVDGSGRSGFDFLGNLDFKTFAGSVNGEAGEAIDNFVFTLQSGASREQRFGSRIPYRTSLVTEQGVYISGNVEYQELESVVAVSIKEASNGAKAEITISNKRPGTETDGLFEVYQEAIETEIFVREKPVLIGHLKRWQSETGGAAGWPFTNYLQSLRARNYSVYFHAVRLERPKNVE